MDHTLEFSSLNTEVRNIRIDFNADQPAQNIAVKIQFTDSAHQTYFDTTEYTVGIPDASVSTVVDPSKFINLQTAGYVENLRIEVVGEDVSYPILLNGVSLNAHRPFAFNPLRFVAVFGLLLLGYAFRPRSAIYRIRIVENPRKSKAGIIFAVAIELALTTTFLFYGSNLVGVATSSYNYGAWNGTSLVNTFEVGGDNAQQYAMLAQAMAKGQLYLEEEPPQWLKDMEDPYDKGARDEAQKRPAIPICSTWPIMTGTTTSTSAWCRCCCSTCPSIFSPGPISPRPSACSLWRCCSVLEPRPARTGSPATISVR